MEISTYFSKVKDFRVIGRCSHLLGDILGLVIVGVLADCDDFVEIADYGQSNIAFLRSELGFSKAESNISHLLSGSGSDKTKR